MENGGITPHIRWRETPHGRYLSICGRAFKHIDEYSDDYLAWHGTNRTGCGVGDRLRAIIKNENQNP